MKPIPQHMDDRIPLSREDIDCLKPGTIARLRKNGRAHMGRARRRNEDLIALNDNIEDPRFLHKLIEIENFDPIEVYEEHNWTCPHCFKRVDVTKSGIDPMSCVLGHMINFANGGGHTRKNCGPWHYGCNKAIADAKETPREGKVRRLRRAQGILDGKPVPKSYGKKLSSGKGWGNKGRSKWPKGRKIQSANNLRKKK